MNAVGLYLYGSSRFFVVYEFMLCLIDLSSQQTLITFVNKHLNKLNLEVTELDTQVNHCCKTVNASGANTLIYKPTFLS